MVLKATSNAIIRCENVTYKGFDRFSKSEKTVLNNINFEINKGEFISIIGENGCGKSTLSKLLNGLILPTSGNVFINNLNTKEPGNNLDIKKSVGLVFQNPESQIIEATIEEEIAFGLENLCYSSEVISDKIKKSLKYVGLQGLEKMSTNALSGGQKQKLCIASIVAMEPKVIIFDEPTSMLDPKSKKVILDLIFELKKELNITTILITHNIDEAMLADKVLIMDDKFHNELFENPKEVLCSPEFINYEKFECLTSIYILNSLKKSGYEVNTTKIDTNDCAKEILNLLRKYNNATNK
ncbi:MAG: ATP-binding cassette domain-containing protein [Clostridia bacterium]|nr:ATP-binding cassette domain-containing protein [Clostridia bacterium]